MTLLRTDGLSTVRTTYQLMREKKSATEVEMSEQRLETEASESARGQAPLLAEHVEELARASDLRFRALVDAATDAIVCSDTRGRVTYFNHAAERTFGYAAVEIVGGDITALMPERYQDAHRHGFQRYIETGEARYIGKTIELVGRRKDGSEFALELSLTSLPNRYRDGSFVGFVRDISGRRRSEEALKLARSKLEAQLKTHGQRRTDVAGEEPPRQMGDREQVENLCRLVVESAPNAMLVVDEAGEIVLVNRRSASKPGDGE